jgi:biofilm PGA synthesis N-glycosyltransferase PgaC
MSGSGARAHDPTQPPYPLKADKTEMASKGVDRRGVRGQHSVVVERIPLGGLKRRERPVVGLRPTVRFAIAVSLTAAWVALGVYLSRPWRSDLEEAFGPILAWVIPITLAYIPGFVIGFLVFTLLSTRYHLPDLTVLRGGGPAVTIVVAARNERDGIGRTLEHIGELAYPGAIRVLLADNGSDDGTADVATETAARLGIDLEVIVEHEPGKHRALNAALAAVDTDLVVTVDADTHPQRDSLTLLVARVMSRPQGQHVCACAGALVTENPTTNFLTRMQQWDYRLGITGVKRTQAAYNSTLVAQGAFSAYWTEDVRAVGGWPDAIGEDIVLTWSLMGSRGIVQFEPLAVAFTAVPTKLDAFMRQRSRWARGMFEGLRTHPPHTQPRLLAKFAAGIDYLIPFLDAGYVFFWIPGFALFLFGHPIIVGWWSMLLIPMSLAVFGLMRRWQERHVFRRLAIRPEPDRRGFLGYLLCYQSLISAAALRGYGQWTVGARRTWK